MRGCGSRILAIACGQCGELTEHDSRCRVAALCLSCRGRIAWEYRRRFVRARDELRKQAGRMGLLRRLRRGGRWSEKFGTLTLPPARRPPHIGERIAITFKAWKRFRTSMSRWAKARGLPMPLRWVRSGEWEEGEADEFGNPHIHFWIFSPFLPVRLVKRWWLDALELPEDTDVRIDLEVADEHVDRELIKYMTKDLRSGGAELVHAERYAEMYKAIDGRRIVQCSRGLWQLAAQAARCGCGAEGPWIVRHRDREPVHECHHDELPPVPQARPPPDDDDPWDVMDLNDAVWRAANGPALDALAAKLREELAGGRFAVSAGNAGLTVYPFDGTLRSGA